jgi:hypothetical protein
MRLASFVSPTEIRTAGFRALVSTTLKRIEFSDCFLVARGGRSCRAGCGQDAHVSDLRRGPSARIRTEMGNADYQGEPHVFRTQRLSLKKAGARCLWISPRGVSYQIDPNDDRSISGLCYVQRYSLVANAREVRMRGCSLKPSSRRLCARRPAGFRSTLATISRIRERRWRSRA